MAINLRFNAFYEDMWLIARIDPSKTPGKMQDIECQELQRYVPFVISGGSVLIFSGSLVRFFLRFSVNPLSSTFLSAVRDKRRGCFRVL